jgi:hypothetical protein
VETNSGDPPDQRVRKSGRQASREGAVLPVAAPAAHEVVSLVQLGQQLGHVRGIVLEVAVHEHDDVAAGLLQPRGHRRGLARVGPQAHQREAGEPGKLTLDQRRRPVAAAVVDQDHLGGPLEARNERLQLREESWNALLLVEERND